MNRDDAPEPDAPESRRGGDARGGAARWAKIARRTGAGAVWTVGLAIVLVSVAALGIIALSRRPEGSRLSLTLANRALAKSSNLQIEAGRTLLVEHGARIVDLRLVAIDSLGVRHALLSAREARLTTSWWGLVRGRPGELVLDLDRPVLSLVRTPGGRWLLPRFKEPAKGTVPSTEPLSLTVTMKDGVVRFIRPGESPDTVAAGLALRGSLEREGARWNVALARGSAALPGLGLALERTTGSARFENGAFTVPRFVLRTDAGWFEIKGDGRLTPDLTAQGSLELGEWEWRTLARVTGQKALDLDGGAAGRVAFAMGDEGLALSDGSFDVLWRDEPARVRFDGRWREDHLSLTNAAVDWRRAAFRGSFDWLNRRRQWALDGRVSELDLAELPRLWPMSSLDTTRLEADVHLASSAEGLRGRVARGAGTYRGVAVDSVTGTWSLVRGVQSLDARARVAAGGAFARGTITRAGLALEVGASNLSASALPARAWRSLGVSSPPSGRLRELAARVSGPASSPRVTGRARVEDLTWGALELARAAAEFDGRLGAGAGVFVTAQGQGARFGPARADTAWARGRVGPDSIVVERFVATRVDSVLELAGKAHRVGDAWDARIETLRWSSTGLELAAEGAIDARIHTDGGMDVRAAHIVSSAGSFSARGSWGGSSRASDLMLSLETLDLEALLGSIAEDSHLRGVVTGDARFEGPPGGELWTLDLAARDVTYREFGARAIEARGRFAARHWTVDRLSVETGHGRLGFAGDLDWSGSPPWSGSTADWNHALEQAPRWQGMLTADSLAVAQIAEWVPALGGWRGDLDARIDLSGRPAAPVAHATGGLRAPGWGTATLADVVYDLAYEGDVVTIRRFVSGPGDSSTVFAQGTLPIRLGWGVPVAERLPDRPLSLEVRARGLDLGIVTTVLPPVAAAAGRADLTATITGTPKQPHTQGRLRVTNGIVRPSGREEIFSAVDAEFELAGDELRVVHAEARQGKSGKIVVQPGGWAKLKDFKIDDYAIDVTARDVTAFSSGEYVIRLNGRFKIEDGLRRSGPLPLPHITGNAQVVEGVFLYNFGDPSRQAASQGPVVAPPWTYDVFVEADNNLWYRPPDANIEGKLTDFEVIQEANRFLMLGGVEALRGRYFFLGTQFDVEQGTLFFDAAQPNNPTVDATFTTQKALPLSQGGARELVTLTVSGRALAPNVSLTSSPTNLSQSEIVSLLTFGQLGGGVAAVGSLASQYLVNQLVQEVPALSDLGVEYGSTVATSSDGTTTASKSYTKLGLSRYFTRDLLVRYSQVVGDVTQATTVDYQDLIAEYRLNRLLFLSGQVTRRRGVLITAQDQTVYRFDVHARYEY